MPALFYFLPTQCSHGYLFENLSCCILIEHSPRIFQHFILLYKIKIIFCYLIKEDFFLRNILTSLELHVLTINHTLLRIH